MPSIRRRDVACAGWPNIRRFKHFLYLLDIVNDAFYVHASQSSKRKRGAVNIAAALVIRPVRKAIRLSFAAPQKVTPLERPLKQSFAIRKATLADCPAILQCLRLAFAPYIESYTPEAFTDTVLTTETCRDRLSEMSVLVATSSSGDVVGTIAYKVLESGEGHLRGMAVRPEWHGSGLSKSLLKTAEDELQKSAGRTITLDTTEPLRRAIRFYEQNGYRATSKIGHFFGMPLFENGKNIDSDDPV